MMAVVSDGGASEVALLSVREASRRLGISGEAVRKAIRGGRLPAIVQEPVGGKRTYWLTEEAVAAYSRRDEDALSERIDYLSLQLELAEARVRDLERELDSALARAERAEREAAVQAEELEMRKRLVALLNAGTASEARRLAESL